MAKLVTHGHREDAQLAAGRFVEGDPEHDALKARFLELLRA
jgi:hypothetical protein